MKVRYAPHGKLISECYHALRKEHSANPRNKINVWKLKRLRTLNQLVKEFKNSTSTQHCIRLMLPNQSNFSDAVPPVDGNFHYIENRKVGQILPRGISYY